MVLDVFVEGCEDSMSCQYSGFGKFRLQILRGWNEELGRLYQEKYSFLFDREGLGFLRLASVLSQKESIESFFKSYDEKMDRILNEFDKPHNEGMKIFARHSDCDGEITPEQSILVLDSFLRVDIEKFDDSNEEMNEWYRETYHTWIKMLKYSIENGKSIIFG